jgi:hypothetical protein
MEKNGKNKNSKTEKNTFKIGKMYSETVNQSIKRAYLCLKMYTNVHAARLFTFIIGARNILIDNAPVHFAYFANYILHK